MTIDATNGVELHGLWIATVKGYGGAHIARMLSGGFTWSFGGGLSGPRYCAVTSRRDDTGDQEK